MSAELNWPLQACCSAAPVRRPHGTSDLVFEKEKKKNRDKKKKTGAQTNHLMKKRDNGSVFRWPSLSLLPVMKTDLIISADRAPPPNRTLIMA